MEKGTRCCRPRGDGPIVLLKLTRAQARALSRIIHAQLDAYAEALGVPPRRRRRPVTVADLDRVEPLLIRL